MNNKIWWIIGGAAALAGVAAVATMARIRTAAPDAMQDAAEETTGVVESFVYRESSLLGLDKTAGANVAVTAADSTALETTVREVFANVEQAMLHYGFDSLTVTARSEDGRMMMEATNVDGPLSVIEIPVSAEQAPELEMVPIESLEEHLEHVILAQ